MNLCSHIGRGLRLRQPAAAFHKPACWPGSQCHTRKKTEGTSFPSHSLFAVDCGVQSGSRLPHSM
jgi:hypothetical protein